MEMRGDRQREKCHLFLHVYNPTGAASKEIAFHATLSRIFVSILCALLFIVIELTPACAEEYIEITLNNFLVAKNSHGYLRYYPRTEKGIPASGHILVVRSCHCLDDATDIKGNAYYFYVVDHTSGLKALITAAELNPVRELDEGLREFVNVVQEEMRRDGGIKSLIQKFKKDH